jgi:glyoxylase-like metal-dependent hydrolase (beta-lactamase superfamily II)
VADGWVEVAADVYVRRWGELDLSLGLVVGGRGCLVVDTGTDGVQGRRWAGLVRQVTGVPWQVAVTHAHFDHCFGTAAFLPCPVWARPECAAALAATGGAQRAEWAGYYRRHGRPGMARRVAAVEPVVPDRLVVGVTELELGGRRVRLVPVVKAHTDHDMFVELPDDGVVFAGDLVEQGAPPSFGDAYPGSWPAALDAVLATGAGTVVPGHGVPVGRDFVVAQRDELATVAGLGRAVAAGELSRAEAVNRSPYPEGVTVEALAREDGAHD